MRTKEVERLSIVSRVSSKNITQAIAAKLLCRKLSSQARQIECQLQGWKPNLATVQ